MADKTTEKYLVTGMSCAACQAHVEKAVSGVDGVESCSVSLLTKSMSVTGTADPKKIIKVIVRKTMHNTEQMSIIS